MDEFKYEENQIQFELWVPDNPTNAGGANDEWVKIKLVEIDSNSTHLFTLLGYEKLIHKTIIKIQSLGH